MHFSEFDNQKLDVIRSVLSTNTTLTFQEVRDKLNIKQTFREMKLEEERLVKELQTTAEQEEDLRKKRRAERRGFVKKVVQAEKDATKKAEKEEKEEKEKKEKEENDDSKPKLPNEDWKNSRYYKMHHKDLK